MLEVKPFHLDEFTLLRHVVGDLEETERKPAEEHLRQCGSCSEVLDEIRRLDQELRLLAQDESFRPAAEQDLPPGDPFRSRPQTVHRRPSASGFDREKLAARALADSERGWLRVSAFSRRLALPLAS